MLVQSVTTGTEPKDKAEDTVKPSDDANRDLGTGDEASLTSSATKSSNWTPPKISTPSSSTEMFLNVLTVNTTKGFAKYTMKKGVLTAVYFYAHWVEPCRKIKEKGVYERLCRSFPAVRFLQVEEEGKPEGINSNIE